MAPPGPPRPPSAPTSAARWATRLPAIWQKRGAAACALWPLSLLYGALVLLRRKLYQAGWFKSEHPGRPVIVVGNVIAGGAGKTPVVIALVRHLQSVGRHPGVISRGYGRSSSDDCLPVAPDSPASLVGDEPALIARSCGVPVFVAARRTTAARALIAAHPHTDVLVCDDGLQHLALARDLEVCIFNARGIGNGFLLPAGPLREPWPRTVDFMLYPDDAGPAVSSLAATAVAAGARVHGMCRRLASYALRQDGTQVPLQDLRGLPLHAVAAIARPEDFFAMLRAEALQLEHTEALPDHFNFEDWERSPPSGTLLLCTEKDAVKLWPRHPDALAVPLELRLPPSFFAELDALVPVVAKRTP